MTPTEIKIIEIQTSIDHLQCGFAILKAAGYGPYTEPHKYAQRAINALRSDLWGLQSGNYPYAMVNS